MSTTSPDNFLKGIVRQVQGSRRPVTILFTDIEGSTRYWENHGDIKGRLMVDRHNRLIFPVIRHFGGKVVKTIGDAIMASFRGPEQALNAAMAIQQVLERERNRDRYFKLRIRIGVHTGQAIVEKGDIFGDTVNVAARVESKGKGDEIVVSGSTAQRVKNADFYLTKKGSFVPKGKKNAMTIYRCNWKEAEDLLEHISFNPYLGILGNQKRVLMVYTLATLGALYLLYTRYLRYLIADTEQLALYALDPSRILNIHPAVSVGLVVMAGLVATIGWRAGRVPHRLVRVLKGAAGFAVAFVLLVMPNQFVDLRLGPRWEGVLHSSAHLFVENIADRASVRAEPSFAAPGIKKVKRGDLLLLADVSEQKGVTWNRVLIGKGEYGWIERVRPPRIGVPEERVTVTSKFYFRYYDLYGVLAGMLGFLWGYFNFRVRPI
jgi:class 3 adenylate cyclase